MARDRRIEQARERLRRLKPPPGSAASRLEQLRERARAARAAQSRQWTPPPAPTDPAPQAEPAEPEVVEPEAVEDRPAVAPQPKAPTDGAPLSVPFRPAGRNDEREPSRSELAPPASAGRSAKDRARAAAASAGESMAGAGHWVSDRWATLPVVGRARILAVAIVAAVAAIIWFVLVPSAPCAAPGGDACPAGDDAIALVPDDAVAYVHLNVDSGNPQFEAARDIAARFPLLTQLAIADVSSIAGRPIDFDADVRPWSGGETALAVLPGKGEVEQVLMLEADDEGGAREFADGLLGPAAVSNDIGGTEVLVGDDGFSTVLFDGFLLLGTKGGIAQIVNPPAGSGSLEGGASASMHSIGSPKRASLTAYLSPGGSADLLESGDFSSLDTFVDSEATAGVAASLSVDGDYVDVSIRSDLDPEGADASPGFFAALPGFRPTLTADVGADSLAYLGFGDPSTSIDSLRLQAAAGAPDLLAAFDRFEEGLRRDGGISLEEDLLPLLGSEVAISVEPVFDDEITPAPGTVVSSGTPYVSLIAAGVDDTAAATALASLQGPLIDALAPEGGAQVPAFESSEIEGVEAQSLFVSPQVDLTYATFADRLVLATNRLAVQQAQAGDGGLAGADGFDELTEVLPDEVSLLAYLNLDGLLGLGEQVGLAEDPAYATFAPDLRNLKAAALSVVGGGDVIDTDLRIATGEPQEVGVATQPATGE